MRLPFFGRWSLFSRICNFFPEHFGGAGEEDDGEAGESGDGVVGGVVGANFVRENL